MTTAPVDEDSRELKRWAKTADVGDPIRWGDLEATVRSLPRPPQDDLEWRRQEAPRTSVPQAVLIGVLLLPMVCLTVGLPVVAFGIVAAHVVLDHDVPYGACPWLDLGLIAGIFVTLAVLGIWAGRKRRDALSLLTALVSTVAFAGSYLLLTTDSVAPIGMWADVQLLSLVGAVAGLVSSGLLLVVAKPTPRRTFREWSRRHDISADELWLQSRRWEVLEQLVKRKLVVEADAQAVSRLPLGSWQDLESLPDGRVVRRPPEAGSSRPAATATPLPFGPGSSTADPDPTPTQDPTPTDDLATWAATAEVGDPVRWGEVEERILAAPRPRRKVMRRDQARRALSLSVGGALQLTLMALAMGLPTAGASLVGLVLVASARTLGDELPSTLRLILHVELVVAVLAVVLALGFWSTSRRRDPLMVTVVGGTGVCSALTWLLLRSASTPPAGPGSVAAILAAVGAVAGLAVLAFLLLVADPRPDLTLREAVERRRESPEDSWTRGQRVPVLEQLRRRGLVGKEDAKAMQRLPVGTWRDLESLPDGRVARRRPARRTTRRDART